MNSFELFVLMWLASFSGCLCALVVRGVAGRIQTAYDVWRAKRDVTKAFKMPKQK